MQSIFMGPEGKKELKENHKAKIIQLQKRRGDKLKLIKFEVWRGGWRDYSLVHPKLNEIRMLGGVNSNEISLWNQGGKVDRLNLSLGDYFEIKGNEFYIIYDDLNKTRCYRGEGMKLTYEFLNE